MIKNQLVDLLSLYDRKKPFFLPKNIIEDQSTESTDSTEQSDH
jgi:hypothetical protein